MQQGQLCPECSEWDVKDWFLGRAWILWEKPNRSKARDERFQAGDKTKRRRNNKNRRLLRDVKGNEDCPLCRLTIKALSKDPAYGQIPEGIDVEVLYAQLAFFLRCDELGSGKTVESVIGLGAPKYCNRLLVSTSEWDRDGCHPYPVATGSFHLITSTTDGQHDVQEPILRGRAVRSQVDMKLLESWVRRCHEDHEVQCRPEPRDEHLRLDFKLIDVNSGAVVHSSVRASFAALSYVWGPQSVRQVELSSDTYSLLTTRGLSEIWEDVPQTIRDAIALCRSIGIPYLWADQCCIQQDDETDIGQVEYMDVIYGAASLTIVAASGTDSWAGLPGVSPGSRQVQQEMEVIEGLSIGTAQAKYSAAMSSAIWLTRGWTFQEYILSKRILIFTAQQVFYQCSNAFWWEDTHMEVPNPLTVRLDGLHELYRSGPSTIPSRAIDMGIIKKPAIGSLTPENYLEKYLSLAAKFTDRRLTRQSDALRAFKGIISYFSRATEECFFAGLPLSGIHAALLFAISHPKPQHRRKEFPSWSWTGWDSSRLDGDYIGYEFCEWEPEAALYRIEHTSDINVAESVQFTRIQDRRMSTLSRESYTPRSLWKLSIRKDLLKDLGVDNLLAVLAPTPNIVITGTPGVGKTSHAELLARNTGLKHLSINQVVKERDCNDGWDEEFKTWIVDEDKLLDAIEDEVQEGGCIIDWHACDLFPKRWIDLVVVIRCDSTTLYDRLTARGYAEKKLEENMDAEIMEVLLEEARESYDEEIVVELRSDNAEDIENNVERIEVWIKNWKENNRADGEA
ncbi:factor activating pos9 [Coniosporium apollinis]|uniref:Adenylate kinase isoenzyme 6 homolog n=1 Tax=Coniosporium apollinis TaxID=61459 RepID=A0ABQ9NNX2_9PEZI|nr:factor activating pos9 [Coniosporium apollinis]